MSCSGACPLTLPLLPRSTVSVVNVDPANDHLPYPVAVDTRDLVDLGEVMERMQLGPNGGTLFCLEYLEKNIDWLKEKLTSLKGRLPTHNSAP